MIRYTVSMPAWPHPEIDLDEISETVWYTHPHLAVVCAERDTEPMWTGENWEMDVRVVVDDPADTPEAQRLHTVTGVRPAPLEFPLRDRCAECNSEEVRLVVSADQSRYVQTCHQCGTVNAHTDLIIKAST